MVKGFGKTRRCGHPAHQSPITNDPSLSSMAGLVDLVQGFECNRIAPGGLGGHVAFERQPGVLDGRVLVQGQTRRSLDCVQGKERLGPRAWRMANSAGLPARAPEFSPEKPFPVLPPRRARILLSWRNSSETPRTRRSGKF